MVEVVDRSHMECRKCGRGCRQMSYGMWKVWWRLWKCCQCVMFCSVGVVLMYSNVSVFLRIGC